MTIEITIEEANKLKVDELKTVLKNHGLSVVGKKTDLLDRLIEHINGSKVENNESKISNNIDEPIIAKEIEISTDPIVSVEEPIISNSLPVLNNEETEAETIDDLYNFDNEDHIPISSSVILNDDVVDYSDEIVIENSNVTNETINEESIKTAVVENKPILAKGKDANELKQKLIQLKALKATPTKEQTKDANDTTKTPSTSKEGKIIVLNKNAPLKITIPNLPTKIENNIEKTNEKSIEKINENENENKKKNEKLFEKTIENTNAKVIEKLVEKVIIEEPKVSIETTHIRIDNFTRPLQIVDLLLWIQQITGFNYLTEQSIWINRIKSHCYIDLQSIEHSKQLINKINGLKFPKESKLLLICNYTQISVDEIRTGHVEGTLKPNEWKSHKFLSKNNTNNPINLTLNTNNATNDNSNDNSNINITSNIISNVISNVNSNMNLNTNVITNLSINITPINAATTIFKSAFNSLNKPITPKSINGLNDRIGGVLKVEDGLQSRKKRLEIENNTILTSKSNNQSKIAKFSHNNSNNSNNISNNNETMKLDSMKPMKKILKKKMKQLKQ